MDSPRFGVTPGDDNWVEFGLDKVWAINGKPGNLTRGTGGLPQHLRDSYYGIYNRWASK